MTASEPSPAVAVCLGLTDLQGDEASLSDADGVCVLCLALECCLSARCGHGCRGEEREWKRVEGLRVLGYVDRCHVKVCSEEEPTLGLL